MPKGKSALKLLDEILQETKNYRCEYLEILIEKYVKTEDEVVDIHIRNCTISKSTNYLKKIEEKPFGYVSSYDCKSAKKSVHCWKKKVISQKRASFRKFVGVESSDEDHFTKAKEKFGYLTRSKTRKALLSIPEDDSHSSVEESENTSSDQTDLDEDECSVSLVEEKENTILHEDDPSLSKTVEKILNEVSKENETIKSSATSHENKLLPNNVQRFPNFETKNFDANLLKSCNYKQVRILIEHFSLVGSNMYDDNVDKIKHLKNAAHLKSVISSSKKEMANGTVSTFSVSNSKSLSDYISSKSTPRFRFSEIGMGISNKNCQGPNVCNVKSILYDSNKSTEEQIYKSIESPAQRFCKSVTRACDKKYKSLLNSPTLKSTSLKIPITPRSESFVTIDPLSLKKVHTKKKSSTETPLSFRSRKEYISYLESNCTVDDLSLTKVSSPQKTPKNRQKEACKK